MRFRILGPLRVDGGTGEVALSGRKQRTILALLVANAPAVVSWEHLFEAVWDDDPPPTARRQIQNCVAALRRLVPGDNFIVTEGPGYRLAAGEDEVDVRLFARHLARAHELTAAGRSADAAAEYRSALRLWRGPALFGLAGRMVEAVATGLNDQRLAAVEECADLELALGRQASLLPELTALVEANPLRERLVGQLMLALFRSGRQADAMQTYHRLRSVLADELGVDPGAALQRVYTELLTSGPEPAPSREPGPCHLPRAVPDFVGRSATLTSLLAAAGTPTVVSIAGMAGVGKTALAVHLAHRLIDRYPDGQLHAELHGHADRAPADPGTVLGVLLRQLGVPATRVPESADDRAALWRTELAGRRMLVLLDNAAGSRQVAPLLAGAAGTLVIVTSRRLLAGLDGVRSVSLGALPENESAELLRRIVGARAAEEPEATAELARLCGHLPLALRLAAARLVRRSAWRVADLAERLREAPARLGQLAAEDRAVSAALDLSYQQLDDPVRRMFRALGGHGRHGFDRHAAAALAGMDVTSADELLDDLVDAYLLETPAAGWYRLHDLVHDYAAQLLAGDPPADLAAAEHRLIAHYLHAAAAATAHFERPAVRTALTLDDPPPAGPAFPDTGRAVTWLDRNWRSALAAAGLAERRGLDTYTWRIARALWPYLYRNGHSAELVDSHTRALAAAHRLGDDTAEAAIHSCLAAGYANLRRYDDTERHLRERFAALRRTGDHRGIVTALNNLAMLQLYAAGQPQQAVASLLEARELAESIGAEHETYLCARTLGMTYRILGRHDDARAQLHLALDGFARVGEKAWTSLILGELGGVHADAGDHATALPLLQRAMAMKQAEGNRGGTATVLSTLGEIYGLQGHADEAFEYHRQALDLVADEHHSAPSVLNHYGRTLARHGDRGEALAAHRRALDLLGPVHNRYERAHAHAGMAGALRDTDPAAAYRHLRQALEIFTDMGVPEAASLRQSFAGLAALETA
ncbi:AfsR/SARP family transcriptional regulator [Paractinoplanes rishiriensis]|uniref:SARP family transcriptional regulator n=1 Tax=Paractinoplanes rishiriensis TaxID=1050105 RepID=A0A919JXX1_9ACTN|nr:BTAD domain-containing putative transcriptional regulator [Actinoplanes rishiriensis]GIE95684.1 SARP family transcriptional regulator [Actinoplanes rishiriensis]